MRRPIKALAGIAAAALAAALWTTTALAPRASAAALTQVPDFGANPGTMQMYVYVPGSVPAHPAILVAMHGCNGSAPGFYQGTEFASLADRYGFTVIYPQASHSANGMSNCFDVWSDAALRHGGGSDPVSIVGAPFSGIPYGCMAGGGMCGDKTPQQWGETVRAAYPGYSEPDAHVHRHPAVRVDPAAVRRLFRRRGRRGVHHRRSGPRPAASGDGRLRDPLLRPGRRWRDRRVIDVPRDRDGRLLVRWDDREPHDRQHRNPAFILTGAACAVGTSG
jgi:hypothetical protein